MKQKAFKSKKCKACGNKFTPARAFQPCCSPACAIQHVRDKKHKKLKAEFYVNDLPKQKELTQKAFNKLRKLQELKWFSDRGLEPECISCGKTNMDWCCGHFKTVGSQGALRYDEKNTYLQCNRYCNMGLSGNIHGNKNTRGFIKGLKERFGEEEAQKIIDYCEQDREKKWTAEELIELRKQINQKIREFTKQQ